MQNLKDLESSIPEELLFKGYEKLEIDSVKVPRDVYQGDDRLDLSDSAIYGDGENLSIGVSAFTWLGEQIAGFAFSKIAEWGCNSIFHAFSKPNDEPKLKDVMNKMSAIQKKLDQMNETLGNIMVKLDDIIRNQKLESLKSHIRLKQEKYITLAEAVNQTMGNLTDVGTTEAKQRKVLSNWYHTPLNGSQNALQATLVFMKTIIDQTTGYDMFEAYDKFMELSNYGWESETYAFKEMMQSCDMTLILNAVMLTSLYLRAEISDNSEVSAYDIKSLNDGVQSICKYYEEKLVKRLPKGVNRFIGNKNDILIYKLLDTGKQAMHRDGFTTDIRTWKNYLVDEKGKNRVINEAEIKQICAYYQGKELMKYLFLGGFELYFMKEKGYAKSFVLWIYENPVLYKNDGYSFYPKCFIGKQSKDGNMNAYKFFAPGPKLDLADNGTKYIKTLKDYSAPMNSLFVVDSSF